MRKSQALAVDPVFETQPSCMVGGFGVYAGEEKLDIFPPGGSRFSLLVSVRSTSFGYTTLRRALTLISDFSDTCLLSVVDSPYRWNALAQPRPSSEFEIMTEIEKLSSEVWRRIDNITDGFPYLKVEQKRWSDLSAITPQWMKDECKAAFDANGRFSECLKAATMSVFAGRMLSVNVGTAAKFLVEELPVLCWLYYVSPIRYIDLYPGKPFVFFRALENGKFKFELPRITKIASGIRRFIHVDIGQKRRY